MLSFPWESIPEPVKGPMCQGIEKFKRAREISEFFPVQKLEVDMQVPLFKATINPTYSQLSPSPSPGSLRAAFISQKSSLAKP